MSGWEKHLEYKKGRAHLSGVSLEKIAESTGTPVYVYSAAAIVKPLKEIQERLASIDHLVCFAVKSNSNLAILKLVTSAGAGLDIVSGGELYRASQVGVAGNMIVFSGVGKSIGEMVSALTYDEAGILSFNVESVAELAILSAIAQKLGKRAQVALRFNPDVDAKTHPYVSTGLKENKFGITRSEVLEIARGIRQEEQYPGVRLVGLSIHIGSQLLSLAPLDDAFAKVAELALELNRILPEPVTHLDLGGGVGISYRKERSPSIQDYCSLILKHFGPNSKFAKGSKTPFKICIEPGRLLAGNAGVLLTEVLYWKKRPEKNFLVVDAAMNDLIRPSLYESYHEIVPVGVSRPDQRKQKRLKADVVGPVCETGDFFARNRSIPSNIQRGDLLAILSAGAYGFTMSSNYNSRPRVPEVLIEKRGFRVIRNREEYSDLIRGEHL